MLLCFAFVLAPTGSMGIKKVHPAGKAKVNKNERWKGSSNPLLPGLLLYFSSFI